MKKAERVTLLLTRRDERRESERKANRIKEGSGIFDHGQESPHGFLDVSHLTSAM